MRDEPESLIYPYDFDFVPPKSDEMPIYTIIKKIIFLFYISAVYGNFYYNLGKYI
jgi:hypothetical protein